MQQKQTKSELAKLCCCSSVGLTFCVLKCWMFQAICVLAMEHCNQDDTALCCPCRTSRQTQDQQKGMIAAKTIYRSSRPHATKQVLCRSCLGIMSSFTIPRRWFCGLQARNKSTRENVSVEQSCAELVRTMTRSQKHISSQTRYCWRYSSLSRS